MNVQEELRNFVNEQGINALLRRMEARINSYRMQDLLEPTIVDATITDMDKVLEIIKKKWTIFNIKDVSIDLKSQTVEFKIWGGPYWIPKEYSSYVIFPNEWSEQETEKYNYQRTTKEEYAEKNSIPLKEFVGNGVEVTIV